MKNLLFYLLSIVAFLSVQAISQVNYQLTYLQPGFHISYVANYPTIPKIDGCDDVIAGLDLNKNGKLEILAINDPTVSSPSSGDTTKWIFWFENDGNDNYKLLWSAAMPLQNAASGYSFPGVNVADVDGDGNPEIVFVNPSNADPARGVTNPDKIFFYEFDPIAKTFPSEPTFSWNLDYPADGDAGFRLTYLLAGDFDDDGKQEIALIDRTSRIHMWIISLEGNDLNPFSTFKVEFQDSSLTATWAFDVQVVDFDKDGKKEVWFGTWSNFTWQIIEAEGPDNYVIKKTINLPTVVGSGTLVGTLRNLKFMDLNGDGYPEGIAMATNGKLVIIENKQPADVSQIDSTYFIKVGGWDYVRGADYSDLDGDGNLDIIVAGNYRQVYHIEYKGSGPYTDSTSYTWELFLEDTSNVRFYYVSIPPRDMDGDWKREVVIGSLQRPDSTKAFFLVVESDVAVKVYAENELPTGYILEQNYPNPFNPSTKISFILPKGENVTLEIYTLLGQKVKTLIDGKYFEMGRHIVEWDGTDESGNMVTSGVYIYKIKAGKFETSKKMVLIR